MTDAIPNMPMSAVPDAAIAARKALPSLQFFIDWPASMA
jgi:hypothetical protein